MAFDYRNFIRDMLSAGAGVGGSSLTADAAAGLAGNAAQTDLGQKNLDLKDWLSKQQLGAYNQRQGLLYNLLGYNPDGSPGGGAGGTSGGLGSGALFGGAPAQLYKENMADIMNSGQGETNRINQKFGSLANSAAANLEARGLGSSNLTGAARIGAEREKQNALLDLGDRQAQQRIGARTGESQRQSSLLQSLLGQLGDFNLNFDLG